MTYTQLPDEMPTELIEALERHDLRDAQHLLGRRPPHLIADDLARMDAVDAVVAFRLLDKDQAIEVFEELAPVDQQAMLMGLRDSAFRDLVENLDPDDRVRMLREAPAKVVRRVLAGLSAHERRMTAAILGYPEGSVGRCMTPEVVPLATDMTVGQSLDRVRLAGADAETVYTLPVMDGGRRLTGVVALRDLVLSSPDDPLADHVVTDAPRAHAAEPAEGAARLMRETNVLALPVVDSEGRRMDIVGGDVAGDVSERAGSTAEWEREPHPSDSLRSSGAVVHALREHAGLTRVELGTLVGHSKHTVESVELGRRMPDEVFVERAEEATGNTGALRKAARRVTRGGEVGLAAWFRRWARLEREAVSLCTYECRLVPGLL